MLIVFLSVPVSLPFMTMENHNRVDHFIQPKQSLYQKIPINLTKPDFFENNRIEHI
jgi:hypothetical protein